MLLVKSANVSVELRVFSSNPISVWVDILEELMVLFELVLNIFDNDYTKVLSLSFSSESITYEFKSDIL